MKTDELNHVWEDISYHGSPEYQCAFCDCDRTSELARRQCPKAEEKLGEIVRKKEEE